MRRTAWASHPSETARRRRGRRRRGAGLSLALVVLGALLCRRSDRRRHGDTACEVELRRARRALARLEGSAEQVNHQLGAIRGYCEIAKMKGENGDELARRMDAAIDAVSETAALFQRLLSADRRRHLRRGRRSHPLSGTSAE